MKSISESIIGRSYRGIFIQNHDIVITSDGMILRVLKDLREINQISDLDTDKDIRSGILLASMLPKTIGAYFWRNINDYDDNLIFLPQPGHADIMKIYRNTTGRYDRKFQNIWHESYIDNMKSLIKNDREYKLFWERDEHWKPVVEI